MAVGDTRFGRRVRVTLVALAVAGLSVVMILQARELRDRLAALRETASDNAQWVVLQSEVEALKLQLAIADAQASASPQGLMDVRRWFDVLYSRIDLLRDSAVYQPLLNLPDFAREYDALQAFLDQTIPVIDGSDPGLRAALPHLAGELDAVRAAARRMTLVALLNFAERSEERRVGIQQTISGLAVLTVMLVGLLGLLAVWLLRLYRRGQDQAAAAETASLRLNTIITTSADAIVVTNRGGWIQEFNPAAERIFGYRRSEVVGQNAMTLFFPPDLDMEQRMALARRITASADGRVEPFRIELDVARRDGSLLPVEVAIAATGLVSGSVAVAFVRDISARREGEALLREARDRALTGERTKAEFIAVMSHEMRTPLNGLLGSLALLDQSDLNGDQRELVTMMRTSGQILLDHVNSVLDLSRAEAVEAVVANEPFDADQLIEDCLASQAALARAAGIRLQSLRPSGPIGVVRGDAARLRQILLNLVGNAVKFTEAGSVTLEAERHPPGPGAVEGPVEFRVVDTGPGIVETDQERVFDAFVTLDTSYGRRTGGSGLGLAIARRLARSMGGELGLESEPGEGSLFWLRLPLPAAQAPVPAAAPAATPVVAEPEAPVSVLVIEDNPISRVLAERLLAAAGHAVTVAVDGTEGLALAARHGFDLVLTDISMPGIDGVEVARRLRAGGGPSARARIVALTAHALPEDRARFAAAGIDDCLTKPVTATALTRAAAQTGRGLPPLVEPAVLEVLAGQLGPGRLSDLIRRLDAEAAETLPMLAQAAGPEAVAACHRFCGSAASFGLMRLADRLRRLETALRAGEAEEAGALATGLPALWAATRAALDQPAAARDPAA